MERDPDAKTLILGGDIAPKNMPKVECIEAQRTFLRGKFRAFFEKLKCSRPDVQAFVIMGIGTDLMLQVILIDLRRQASIEVKSGNWREPKVLPGETAY